jgi:hypothetical protein
MVCYPVFSVLKKTPKLRTPDLSEQVKNVLREHDPNCAKFYHENTFRQIRISTIRDNTVRRHKLLIRFSKSMQDCVKRLEAQPKKFLNSWDALIPFAGMWPAVLPGTFPRLANLHCPEVLGFFPTTLCSD